MAIIQGEKSERLASSGRGASSKNLFLLMGRQIGHRDRDRGNTANCYRFQHWIIKNDHNFLPKGRTTAPIAGTFHKQFQINTNWGISSKQCVHSQKGMCLHSFCASLQLQTAAQKFTFLACQNSCFNMQNSSFQKTNLWLIWERTRYISILNQLCLY